MSEDYKPDRYRIGVNAFLERSTVLVSKKEADAGQMISQSLHLFESDDLAIDFINKEKEKRIVEKMDKRKI